MSTSGSGTPGEVLSASVAAGVAKAAAETEVDWREASVVLPVAGTLQHLAFRVPDDAGLIAMRDRIRSHVHQHLRDPALSVDGIARALNCSRRHLYNAFAGEGESPFAEAVEEEAFVELGKVADALDADGGELFFGDFADAVDCAHCQRTEKGNFLRFEHERQAVGFKIR